MASQFEEVLAVRKKVQVGGSGQESPEMIASRTRTFIAWVNKKVEGRGLKIQNLTSDLENGIVLIKLLECLAPGKKMPGRYYARPVIKIQKVQNLAVAFKFITDVEKIAVTNIQQTYILEQKEDAAIALIWLLILHYEIGYKMVDGVSLDIAFLVLKRTLLTWINGVLPGQNITNFNTDWKDGHLLSALVDYCQPGLIPDHASLKAAQSAQNVQNAFTLAETQLRVTPFMSAEELALEKPDEISLMMYLAQFCASGSRGQLVLLAWIQQQIPDENVANFSDSWVSGKALGALTNSVSGGKFPAYSEMSPGNDLGNVEQAMIAAEKILGIRRTVTPAKFSELQLNELLRLSYLAQFMSAKDNKDTLLAIPAAADKVDVSDIQIPNVLGEEKSVWIELDCSDAGYGEVRAEVKGRSSGNILAAVKEVGGDDQIGTDKYRVSFEPLSVDVYDFSIFYGNEHVTGSPFSVNLYPPDPEKVEHTSTTDNSETGQDVALNFETKEAGRGKLTAKAEGELSGPVPVKIFPLGDGTFAVSFHPQFPDIYTVDVFWGKFSAQAIGELTGPVALQVNQDKKSEYLVSFKPPNPDVYMVDVSWDGKPVPGSPFLIDLLPPPMPEEVECAVPIYDEPGEKAELLVDASNAGSGNIKTHCTGEQVGDVPVELTKIAGRTYQCTFTPPEKDLYTLDVLFDNKHVKGSPFMIDMRPGAVQECGAIEEEPLVQATPDASKCVLLNPPRSGTIVPVGQPLTFAVDSKEAGPGELDVSADGPGVREHPPDISVKPRVEDKNIFDVTFIPKTQSPHDINLTWFNDPIPNTPIRVNAVDPENIVNFHYGRPVGVDCEAEGKSGDLKAVAIHNETDTHYKVKINKIHKSKYKLSFSPRDPGLYRVHVTMKDKEIPESPIFVNYGKPPKPEAVRVNGLNSKCYVGEPMTFTVDTTDAGSGDLAVKSQGPKQKKDKSELTVTDNKNGTHTIDYTPHTIGDHVFTIGWAGKAVPGSPFHSTASERTPDIITDIYLLENYNKPNQKKREIPATEENIKSLFGNPLLVQVTVSDELKDKEFTASATGKDSGPTDLTITKTSSNTHDVLLNPKVQDVYTITAKVGNKEAPRTPVDIKYTAPVSDPSKCRVIGVKELSATIYVNKPLEFKVYAEDAGPGDLTVTADAPYVDEPPVVEVKQSPVESVYDVTYTPKDSGLHTLNFTWGGETIPDTPIQVNISDAPLYGYGKPVGMDITADCKPGDLAANAFHVESNTPYKVDIAKLHKGKYRLTLEPKDPGYYHIHVLLKQNEIPGSPFVIKYGKPPQSDKVSIRDQPDFVYVNRPINFTVDTSEAGSGELSLKASMPRNEQGLNQPELKVKDNKDGTFGIEFVPNVTGKHSFGVLWSGEAVPDSPVNVDVQERGMDLTDLIEDYAPKPLPIVEEKMEAVPVNEVERGNPAIPVEPDRSPSPPKEAQLPDEEQEGPIKVDRRPTPITIVVGKALKLKVKPKDETQRNGVLKARAQGEETGPANVRTSQNEDGVFEVYFNPPEPDYYVIEVTLNGEKVPQSPFHVLYIPAPIEEPVLEAPQQDEMYAVFVPDQPIDYHIDLSKVPSGTLSAKCVGDECGSVPVTYEPVAPGSKKYRVAFVPPQPDLYHLSVFFNDKELKDSPFDIDLRQKKIDERAVMMQMDNLVEAIPIPEEYAQAPEEDISKESTPSVDEQAETLEEVPYEEFTIFIGIPLVVKFHPKSDEHRNGKMSGSAIGDLVGSSEVSTYRRPGEDTHYFRFDPTEPDRYTVDVRMNDEPVPRSPFRVNYIMPPTDASKCRLIGAKEIDDFVEIGSDVNLRVDAKKAGPGDLGVSAECPSDEDSQEVTSMLSATPSQKDTGFYDITYIPQSQGKHSLAFTWADQPIPESPVTIAVIDPSKTEVIPHGKPATIDVDADGTLKATCVHKESNQNYKVKVSKVQKGKYRISFQPKDIGLYIVRAYLKDKEVPQSPFFIRYARPAKPEACKVIGLDDRCYLGDTLSFKVDTTEAGEGDFQIKTLGPDGKETDIHHSDEKDGIYSIELTPTAPGLHELQMTWAGKNIPGHPFPLAVRDHSSEELLAQLYNIDRVGDRHAVDFPADSEVLHSTTDQTLLLKVQARTDEQKKEKLTVTALNKETSEKTNLAVTKTKDDTFEAQFVPSVPQTYTIDAQLGSSPVPHIPFTVKYETPKADAGKCVILGLEKLPEKFQTNQPISFQVDTRLAGNGKLNLTAEGVQVKPKLVAKASKEDPRIIDVTYTPTAPGTHHIKVMWSGEPVPKSPLSFPVEAVPRSPYGKPVGYDLDLDAKAGDIDAYAIHKDTNTRLKVKTNKITKGKYHFSFSPKKPGLYALHILVKKKDIKQSPIYFLYEGPPKPEACIVKDLPEEWFIHEQGTFLVDATEAGSANLHVKVSSPSKGKEGELKVNNNEDGTYTVEHTPEVLGEHKFNLTWAGKAVPDSPVVTKVKKRVPQAKTCLGPYMNVIPVGDRVELDVINLGKYTGDSNYVTASAKGKVGTDQPTVEDKDGMCKINFTPTVADDYTFNVKIHEQDVEGSPFLIKAVEKPCLTADYKPPEEACPTDVEVGKDVCLVVPKDEQLPPGSEPQVEAIGPEGPCEMKLIDQVESSYGLNFTPTVPGDYLVHVKKDKDDEKEIESSPFKIRAIEKESEAQKVYVPEDFQPLIANPIPLGTTVGIDINTADAGYGTLKVKQSGGDGKANIDITERGNSVYACTLTPTERGRCQLNILWNDEDIRGSPFNLTFVPVTGINLEGENFIVGTENKFTVDRKSVIEGKLEIYCSEAQAADVTIQPADDGMEFYCVITVKKEGDYQIIVKYNGYHIVGSPFNVHFQKPAPTNMSFSLNAEGAETSDVSATVQNSLTLEQLPVNLTDLFGGQYGLEFIPTDGLEYLVTIKCRVKVKTVEKVVAGSPFALKYEKQPVDVSKCHAEGEGLAHAVAGQWSSFFVYTEGAGSGQLSVDIAGDVFGDEEAVITAVTPTKFEVKYILRTKGSYRISVTWDGQDITGSAFAVICTAPEYDNSFREPTFPSEVTLGEPIAFTLAPTAPVDPNDIQVQARSKSKVIGTIPGTVTPSEDGSFKCNVEITHPGKYLVEVTHKAAPLSNTPFLVKVSQPAKPENVRASGPGLEDSLVGQEGNFTIETEDAGTGTLSLNVEGPKGGFKVDLNRHPDNDRTIIASYSPQHAGLYVISIKWSGVEIPNSPFQVNIRDEGL